MPILLSLTRIIKIAAPVIMMATTILSMHHVTALDSDVKKKLTINANQAEYNKSKGVATYTGAVIALQGTLKLQADSIKVIAPNNKISTIIATGKKVQFQQSMDDGKMAKGTAKKLVYKLNSKRMELSGAAQVSLGGDNIVGETISYDVRNSAVRASAGKNKGRVKVTFTPTN